MNTQVVREKKGVRVYRKVLKRFGYVECIYQQRIYTDFLKKLV